MTRMWTALHTICCPNVVLAASPNWTSSVHIRGCSNVCRWEDGLSRLVYDTYYPKRKIYLVTSIRWGGCEQRYTRYVVPMWCWRPAQIGPPQYIYEVVVSFVVEKMVWAGWFTFTTILYQVYLVTSTRWGGCGQRYTRYGVSMWCWRPTQIGPPHYIYEVVVSFVVEKMVWAGWFTFRTISTNLYLVPSIGWGGCGQRYTLYAFPMWCWRPAQIWPHQELYDVVVSFVGEETVWVGWFTFPTIRTKVHLVTLICLRVVRLG